MSYLRHIRRFSLCALLGFASVGAASPKVIVNEFYRDNGNFTAGPEWVELLLVEELSAAELNGYFVGDSQTALTSKQFAYGFTGMEGLAASFPAGTLIVVAGTGAAPVADTSYDPASDDWNLVLKNGSAYLTMTGSNGDFAGTDMIWVDTAATGNTLSADAFGVKYPVSGGGAFGAQASVMIPTPSNGGAGGVRALVSDLAGAVVAGNWQQPDPAATPGEPNGGSNTDYIHSLRTIAPVDAAPAVDNTLPADAAVNVAVDSTVTVVFTEPVDVTASAFTLDCPAGTPVTFTQPASSGTSFVLTPASTLPHATTCTVTVVASQVVDQDGTPDSMGADFSFSFTTAAAVPTLSIADVSQLEGNVDNLMTFTVSLTAPAPAGGVQFNIATAGGTATSDVDFVANQISGAVIAAGQTTFAFPVTIKGDDEYEQDEQFTVTVSAVNGAIEGTLVATGTILNDDTAISEIHEIQGSGECSPLLTTCNGNANISGPTVSTRGNVVTAVGSTGFFIQTPDARDDNDPLTSNGIFVYTHAAPQSDTSQALAIGDEVDVTGNVAEYFNMTQIVVNTSRDAANRIVRTGTGVALPAAIVFGEDGVPSKDPDALSCGDTNFECFEGMRVVVANGAVAAANQRRASDLYAEAYMSPYGERGVREKGALFGVTLPPESAAAGQWDGNPELIELDADHLVPAHVGELVGGTRFSAEGVIGYDFGDYEFWPTSFTIVDGSDALPRPVPEAVDTELTIGSFNAYRLCDAVDNRGDPGITATCAATVGLETDTNRVAHETGQVSAYIREVLLSPAIVAMQEVENLSVLQTLASQIASDGGPLYQAWLVDGNDVSGIDVGYLVDPARVINVSVTQLAADEMWDDPRDGMARLHDRPPLLLRGEFIGAGEPFAVQVLNNHTRSRGGVETGDDSSQRLRAKRFTQGASIAALVQDLQTAESSADIPLIVIGDYNAYQFTDGFVDVVGLIAGTYDNDENTCAPNNAVTNCKLPAAGNIVVPALVNAVLLLDADEQYSYNFTEDFGPVQGSTGRDLAVNQVLDHVLFNEVARPHVSGMAYGRANVDASVQRHRVCHYRFRDLSLCPQGPNATPPAPWQPIGSSDHDGLVIYLTAPLPDAIFADGFED